MVRESSENLSIRASLRSLFVVLHKPCFADFLGFTNGLEEPTVQIAIERLATGVGISVGYLRSTRRSDGGAGSNGTIDREHRKHAV